MALREDIEMIRDRTLSMLNDAHDYFTYTQWTWRHLQLAVRHHGLTFSIFNPATSSIANEADLLVRAERYVTRELASATLQQFVSIFENFLFDVLRRWLLAYPHSLSSRQLSGRDILALPDKAAIVDALIEKELKDIFYDRPSNWFEYLKSRVDAGVPAADAEQFAEIKATSTTGRLTLFHHSGKLFLTKSSALYAERFKLSLVPAGTGDTGVSNGRRR